MSYTVIIPSKSAANLDRCVNALCEKQPGLSIIVVDDGIEWEEVRGGFISCSDFKVIDGEKPFVFARNCNLAIKACNGDDDVILLNDDALLETARGFDLLDHISRTHAEFGLISAVTNIAGNPAQRPKQSGLRVEKRTVAFVCAYIPRRTIHAIGLLDERFTEYGWEDNDYCLRVRKAGMKIGVFDDCFVDHATLRSSFRGEPESFRNIEAGRKIYIEKWGAQAWA